MRRWLCSLLILVAGCGGATPAPVHGGPATGLAVLNTDYSTTSLSLLDATGALVRADCVNSATAAAGGATKTISGDVVLPSQPQPGGNVIIIDRGNTALTFVDPTSCTIVRQIPVPGLKTNPHDVVLLGDQKAYVTRYDPNRAATDPNLAGNDIAVVDPTTGELTGRIDLDAYASAVDGATILARPDRAVVAGGQVIVSLNEIDQTFKIYGEGKLVVIDPGTDAVTAAVALTGLANCEGMAYLEAQQALLVACGGPFAGSTAQSGVAIVDLSVSPPVVTRTIFSAAFDGRPLGMEWILALPPAAFAVTNDPKDVQPDALFELDVVAGTTSPVATSGPYTFGRPAGASSPGVLVMPNATRSAPRIELDDVSTSPVTTTTFTSDPVTGLPPREVAPY